MFDGSVGGDVINVVGFTRWSPGNGDGVVTDDAAGGVDLWSSGNCSRVHNDAEQLALAQLAVPP